jgi:hypothetical protein
MYHHNFVQQVGTPWMQKIRHKLGLVYLNLPKFHRKPSKIKNASGEGRTLTYPQKKEEP